MTVDPNSEKQTVQKQEINEETNGIEQEVTSKTELGLDENSAGALCYLAWFITGIIFLVIEKENKFIRFHALQSIVTAASIFIITIVLTFIPLIGLLFSILLMPIILGLWLFLMWKAYNSKTFKLPIIGNFVEEQLAKES